MINKIKSILKRKMKLINKFFKPLIINPRILLGIPVKFHSPARKLLEDTIISHFASHDDLSKVLFVGCDWYTNHYKSFFRNCEFWTIDPSPKQARYGSKNHIIDFLENLNQHIEDGYFDLIICNGVLGFGLNDKELAEQAFDRCYQCLSAGGVFVIGCDDSPDFLSFSLKDLDSLRRFNSLYFPPLDTDCYSLKPEFEYLFSFYTKPNVVSI